MFNNTGTDEIMSDPFETSDTSDPKNDSDVSDAGECIKDYSELEKYFTLPGQFEELSNYEKELYLDQKKKYEDFLEQHNSEAPFPIPPPLFMRQHMEQSKKQGQKTAMKRGNTAAVENNPDGPPTKKGAVNSAPSRQSARVRSQRQAETTNNTVKEAASTNEEEEFSNIKHHFTPTEWSRMNFFAKRHAQAAVDSYNKALSEGLAPPPPKFMFARSASSTIVRSDSPASSLPVSNSSGTDFENSSEPVVIRRRVPSQRLPLRAINQNDNEQSTRTASPVDAQQLDLSQDESNDCNISEKICTLVKKILPNIDISLLEKLVTTLVDVNGVESVEDLALVEFDWLTTAGLKHIQAKKVLQVFSNQDGKENNSVTQERAKMKKNGAKQGDILMRDMQPEPVIASRPQLSNLKLEVGMWDLVLDFGKFKDTLLLSLEKNEQPTASDRLHMVRVLKMDICERFEELKQQNPSITQKCPGRAICKKVVDVIFDNRKTNQRFAFIFQDKLNDQVVGDGKFSLIDQIETCCENKYRVKRTVGERSGVPRKGTRQAACILREKYCPPLTKSQKEEANEIRLDLITIYKSPQCNWDWMHIKNQLNAYSCLAAQRSMITSKKRDIALIIEHWPFLTEVSGLVSHLDNITGSSLSDNFEKFMDSKLENLISYLMLMSPQRIVLNTIQDDVVFGNGSLLHRRLLSALVMLAIHFGEDQSRLISCVEETTLPHEVLDVLPPNTPATPLIVALGNTPYLATRFFLVMDGVVMCTNLSNGLEAAMALCAAYFVFGVLYPSDASTSLTFMEKVMANLSDGSGLSKAQTPKGAVAVSSLSKCQLLEKSMEDFEKEKERLRNVRRS